MQSKKIDLLADVAEYYATKLAQHGATARGVDWNCEESQAQRFEQLSKIIVNADYFSVCDVGCGYGALYDFLASKFETFSYTGIDVSESMIRIAKQRHQDKRNVHFVLSSEPDQVADYSIASGIFNVSLGREYAEWQAYLESNLDLLNRFSHHGFAFNCLTSYSDADKMRDHLFYADPCVLFDLCKRRYSRNVALLHDYELHEFTILVRKQR